MKNRKRALGILLAGCMAASVIVPGVAAGVTADPATAGVTLNGQKVDLQGYLIGGNHYFQLRDLGQAANFGVAWDQASQTIQINTAESYRADRQAVPGTAKLLDENNWAPATRTALNNLIKKNGIQSANYDPANKPYAVFDCDNTTVINDVEEALLVYQIENLAFKIKPEQMADVLETGIPDIDKALNIKNDAGGTMSTADLAADVSSDYKYLYNNYEGFNAGGKMTLEQIYETNEYLDFRAKLRFIYENVNDTFDASVGYPWVTYLFTGMTNAEVKELATASHDYWLAWDEPWGKVTWTSPEALKGKSGVVSTTYKTGIAFPPEMKDLYNTLMENGIDVYICSASFLPVIQAIANPKYGYNVKEENVYAMMLKTDSSGRYINEYNNDYFQTQGKGKSHTINAFIRGKYGNRSPILVAGDSQGDYDMFTDYDDMQLGLIINRVRKDDVKIISKQAADTIGSANARYVLQGRDDNTGVFRPSEKSIPLGSTDEELVAN